MYAYGRKNVLGKSAQASMKTQKSHSVFPESWRTQCVML